MITHDTILGVSTILYLALFFLYILYFTAGKKGILRIAWYGLLATFTMQAAGIGLRWAESYQLGMGHAPLSNYYESLIFFSWTISLIMIVMRKRLYPVITFSGATASLALMACVPFPRGGAGDQPLIPALQSNWLHVHVITCFLAYAAFLVSFTCGGLYFGAGNIADRQDTGRHQLQEHYYWLFHANIWYTNRNTLWALRVGSYWSWNPKKHGSSS